MAAEIGQEAGQRIGPEVGPPSERPGDGTPTPARSWLRVLPLVLLGCAMLAAFATGASRFLSVESVAAHRDSLRAFVAAHAASAPLVFALVYAGAVALSLPGAALLTLAGGFLFGWALGSALAIVAATIGAVLVFLVARTALAAPLRRLVSPRLERFAQGFREGAFSYLLFLRLVPVFPFWLVNLAPALFGVRLKTFALTTLLGIIPGTIAFAVAGAGLDGLVAGQSAARQACLAGGGRACGLDLSLKTLLTPGLMAMLIALAVLSLIPVLLKRFWRQA